MYTQNNEEFFILEYFKNDNPENLTVLDIGANDGELISNSRKVILEGWNGILLEPSEKAFSRLSSLYSDNPKARTLNYGISENSGRFKFFESGSLGFNENDTALYSSIVQKETKRWEGIVKYEETEADFFTFDEFIKLENLPDTKIDFITIDAEGMDVSILKQINLEKLSCRLLCIEWNSVDHIANEIIEYCNKFGLHEITRNPENIILGRNQ
jgi:FkbM family methyltransferase